MEPSAAHSKAKVRPAGGSEGEVNVTVAVGKVTPVTIKLDTTAAGGEEIVIKQKAPTIDVGSTKQGITIGQEYPKNIPTAGRTFVYIRPNADAIRNRPSTTIVLHESFEAWPQGGMWCAFADGHVQLLAEKSQFDAMMNAK